MNNKFFFYICLSFLIINNNNCSSINNKKFLIISNMISFIGGYVLKNLNNKKLKNKIEIIEKSLKKFTVSNKINYNFILCKNIREKKIQELEDELKDLKKINENLNNKLKEKIENDSKQIIANEEFNGDQKDQMIKIGLNTQENDIKKRQEKRINKKNLKTEQSQKNFQIEKDQQFNFQTENSEQDFQIQKNQKSQFNFENEIKDNECYIENEILKRKILNLENNILKSQNDFNLENQGFIDQYEKQNKIIEEKDEIIKNQKFIILNQNEKNSEMFNYIKNIENNLKTIKEKNDKIVKKEININASDKIKLDNFIKELEKKDQNSIAPSQIFREKIKEELREKMAQNKKNKIDEIILKIDKFLSEYKN